MVFEILGYQFFQNALIVAVLASVAAGIIGTYIVIKRMSLITGSISHTAFGGLGISYFLGANPLIGAIIFSLLSAGGISFFRKKSEKRLDILLSFSWSTGMAIGLIFMFLTPGYATDLFTYLFGNILLVSGTDLLIMLALDALIVIIVFLMFNSFLSVTFDEEYSEVRNTPVSLVYFILLSLIAFTIVMLIQVVGIVLVIAILTLPAATARLFGRTVKKIMIFSSIITLISMLGGLIFSYYVNLPAGPVIVLMNSAFYVFSSIARR